MWYVRVTTSTFIAREIERKKEERTQGEREGGEREQ